MYPKVWQLRWFIPATYLAIFLFPLVLMSVLWTSNLHDINELNQQETESRFYQTHKEMVEQEVDGIVSHIADIRAATDAEFHRRLQEHLAIVVRIAEEIYQRTDTLFARERLRDRVLQVIAATMDSGHFHDSLITDAQGQVLFRVVNEGQGEGLLPDQQCLREVVSKAGAVTICRSVRRSATDYLLLLAYFEPLDFVIAVGVTEQMIDEAAKESALKAIGEVRYGEEGEGYLFAFHYDGEYLSHPVAKYIGQNLIDIRDPNGVEINREIARTARAGGGYVDYVWDRYKTGQLVDKVSYVRGIQDWQWAIGTGFYLDTLFDAHREQETLISEQLRRSLIVTIVATIVLMLLTLWLAWRIFRGVDQEIQHFKQFFASNAGESRKIDLHGLAFAEFRELASSANEMLEARLAAEAQLKTVFDHIDDVIYVADPESYELLHVNDAFRSNWGGGEEVIGRQCYEVLQGRDSPCPFCTNDKIFGEHLGRTYRWEFQNEITQRWYGIADKAIPWVDGRYVRFEIASDITEQKAANDERLRSEKFSALGRLTAGVAHELNNPLMGIINFAQYLKSETEPGDERFEVMGDIERETRRCMDIVTNLLAFSRTSPTSAAPREPVDVAQIVKQVLKLLEYRLRKMDITVDLQPGDDLPPVMLRRDAWQQVYLNLVTNAIDALEGRETRRLTTRLRIEGDSLVLEVEDTGTGMDAQTRERMFDPFYSTKPQGRGTGLGLSTCVSLVRDDNGDIQCTSRDGIGTTMTVRWLGCVEVEHE
jgi:signal transduction histidine kinase